MPILIENLRTVGEIMVHCHQQSQELTCDRLDDNTQLLSFDLICHLALP